MGTPPRDFKLLMDSGSSDLWVGAEQCAEAVQQAAAAARSLDGRAKGGAAGAAAAAGGAAAGAQSCGNHVFLGAQSSSSFVDTKTPFTVTYGSGAVAGNIVTDNIAIAGLNLAAHTFGTANEETFQFTGAPFDGLMGLAGSVCDVCCAGLFVFIYMVFVLQGLSQQKTLTPVESLAKAGLITDAITSYKLARLAGM